jgi:hypothetical protein
MELTRKITRLIDRVIKKYPESWCLLPLRNSLMATKSPAVNFNSQQIVAIELVEDPIYFGIFGAVFQELNSLSHFRGELIIVRSINGAIGTNWRARLMRSISISQLITNQWIRVYRGLIDHVGYRNRSLAYPVGDLLDWAKSIIIWRKIRTRTGDFSLTIKGIPVGDLIIDSYLRFSPSPQFNVKDTFVLHLIWQAHCNVRRAIKYFRGVKPNLYLTSYCTYLEHGIPARVALHAGIDVYSFGNLIELGKKLSLSDWYHTNNCANYQDVFNSLDCQSERLAEAERHLCSRLAGGVDPATFYMRKSAYAPSTDSLPADINGAVVVFLHDFFDSPHVYPDLIFPEFWAWVCSTIEVLIDAKINFFLKPHPNQIEISSEVVNKLRAIYPDVKWVPQSVTNVQLVNAKICCGVTVYGTVSHELAYLGVPTIACARHPHHAFDFCKTAKSVAEYEGYLRGAVSIAESFDRLEMSRQALAFFYMHNLHGSPDNLSMRAAVNAYWQCCERGEESVEDLERAFSALRKQPLFVQLAKTMVENSRDK